MANNRWYAVQENREDAWDNGSHSYEEAVAMLRKQGHGLIAVIDEAAGVCEDEIEYADLFDGQEDMTMKHNITIAKRAQAPQKATTTNQAYLTRLPEARALEALINVYDPSDPEYPETEKRFEAFADDLEAAYNRGELSAVEYNSLADIAFFEIPDGLKEVDEDADDYSNMDYIGHGLEEPRPQFHGCGTCGRR